MQSRFYLFQDWRQSTGPICLKGTSILGRIINCRLRLNVYADIRLFLLIGPSHRQSLFQSRKIYINRPRSQRKGDSPQYQSMKRNAAASVRKAISPHKPGDNSIRHKHQHPTVPPNGGLIVRVERKTASAGSGYLAGYLAHSRRAPRPRRRSGALISRSGSRISSSRRLMNTMN